ncbi:6-carboxytetrahydropterin synthase [Macrococcus capreoli]|uniref:6-pyruvoyl trahydropterin synthase family protein n=1 Tax=Macrococcus capreoli TaxID=2982690 RepID=UPI0021D5D903|nr:6-carboxytetrahydropterin synthase [Macrococcus sp. TMW 2.2395]MCU7558451.1 6-carboxytetrahydropterin synthase [Macrococcus sp. TMW 2.2395]
MKRYLYEIEKQFHFSSSHVLNGLPEGHPCGRLHGHNYIAVFVLGADVLNDYGFVVDYRALDSIKRYIDDTLDHRHLNDVLSFQPTAENLAHYLYTTAKYDLDIKEIIEVRVSETPKTWASYRPNH